MGSRLLDTSFTDFEIEITEKEVKISEKVLKPEQIKYLCFSNNSLSITNNC